MTMAIDQREVEKSHPTRQTASWKKKKIYISIDPTKLARKVTNLVNVRFLLSSRSAAFLN